MSEQCVWGELFDDDDKRSLEDGFFICGALSVVLGLWLNLTLLTKLHMDRSYTNLANFTKTALFRRAVAMIPFRKIIDWSGDPLFCDISACVDTFLAVLEIEWLTHVCIERYVVAKYVTNGWQIEKKVYTLFNGLCICFASLYSFLPIFGIGRYGFDFSCNYCTLDMILPATWLRYSIVTMFFLQSIKPTVFMILMLVWACDLENKLKFTEENNRRRNITRNIIIVTIVNILCWTPKALITGGVVLSQIFYAQPIVITSAFYIKWAMWIQWMAPAITAAALLSVDENIRKNCLFKEDFLNNTEHIDDHETKDK